MNDRELRKWIQDQSENIEIPVSLEPENVVKQLEEKAKKKKTAYYRKVIGTAACLAVVAGIGAAGIAGVFGSRGNEGAGIQQAAEQEDETEFGKVAAITTADMDVKRVDRADPFPLCGRWEITCICSVIITRKWTVAELM